MSHFFPSLTEFGHHFNGEFALAWMQSHDDVPIVVSVLYLLLVLYIPTHVMSKRSPIPLRPLSIVWNLLLTVFSTCGAYYCVPRLWEWCTADTIGGLMPEKEGELVPYVAGSFYHSLCYWNKGTFVHGTTGLWMLLIDLSKMVEMLDTVFLVLQKKPVIFLHWYHHLTVMLFCWHAHVTRISSGLWFATMNYCVHSIMYFYYFICACGFRKVIRPIAPLITLLQILQMVFGFLIVAYTGVQQYTHPNGCEVKTSNIYLGLLMYSSYLVLFANFFISRYNLKPHKKRSHSKSHQSHNRAVSNITSTETH